jgi:hypothetical protein
MANACERLANIVTDPKAKKTYQQLAANWRNMNRDSKPTEIGKHLKQTPSALSIMAGLTDIFPDHTAC